MEAEDLAEDLGLGWGAVEVGIDGVLVLNGLTGVDKEVLEFACELGECLVIGVPRFGELDGIGLEGVVATKLEAEVL